MLNIFKERLLEFQGIIDFYFEILKNKLSKVVNFENDLEILNEDSKILKLREYFGIGES